MDGPGPGHPAATVAGGLAGPRGARLLGTLPADAEQALARCFLAGYASVAEVPDEEALRWHTAAALLVQGAARAVRRVQLPALARLGVVLEQAAAVAYGRDDVPGASTSNTWRTR